MQRPSVIEYEYSCKQSLNSPESLIVAVIITLWARFPHVAGCFVAAKTRAVSEILMCYFGEGRAAAVRPLPDEVGRTRQVSGKIVPG
jgi:hypothetical protein